jgi:hypothetical protein
MWTIEGRMKVWEEEENKAKVSKSYPKQKSNSKVYKWKSAVILGFQKLPH